ncbi:hypothetical protein Pint_31303 [Pistacia integerrima]|uniref:Uncharacterized protein n=1 Tax=Pistacia integerrima TaxID=434235 RepID=A0ACC0XQ14_9ROSI|nr:hypothetical protein Pint_31303 [Pistacia integerrima]
MSTKKRSNGFINYWLIPIHHKYQEMPMHSSEILIVMKELSIHSLLILLHSCKIGFHSLSTQENQEKHQMVAPSNNYKILFQRYAT